MACNNKSTKSNDFNSSITFKIVIYHIYVKCYLCFIPTIPIPVSRLSPLFLIPILFLWYTIYFTCSFHFLFRHFRSRSRLWLLTHDSLTPVGLTLFHSYFRFQVFSFIFWLHSYPFRLLHDSTRVTMAFCPHDLACDSFCSYLLISIMIPVHSDFV